MEANVTLKIDKEDLAEELRELVERLASEEISRMVRERAQSMVDKEVRRIISPIVDKYLENALVGREYQYHERNISKRTVDEYIQSVLNGYLSEPVYLYSKTSNDLAKRYMPSSSGGDKRTRAEHWVTEKATKYVDEQLFPRLEERLNEVANQIVPNEDRIQEIIRAEMMRIVSQNE